MSNGYRDMTIFSDWMAAILNLSNMADPGGARSGIRQKLIQYDLKYFCTNFHTFASFRTIPWFLVPNSSN